MYLHLLVGIGCVVVAAAAAVYFSMPTPQPPQRNHRRRQPDNRNDKDHKGNEHKKKGHPDSRPGDKCIICLEGMSSETMRLMHCGHALHELPCYEDYRRVCRQCPYCEMYVMRIDLPGDDCAICCEPMREEEDMEYLRCEHALHKICLQTYKLKKFKECPKCKRSL